MRSHTSNSKRRGVTLVEVLVAIFVMALGLMALLTLFPLGALNMAQAIKDDRTGNAAANAAAVARAAWRAGPSGAPDGDVLHAMLDPSPTVLPTRTGTTGPSYAAYVDGVGWAQLPGVYPPPPPQPIPPYPAYPTTAGNWRCWLAGQPGAMPRATLSFIRQSGGAAFLNPYYFSFRDDLVFDANAVAGTGLGVQREGLYSWAYVTQLPSCSTPTVADLTVVVYRRRNQQATQDVIGAGEAIYSGYPGYTSTFQPSTKTVTIRMAPGQDPPAVRRGGWILDCTQADPNTPTNIGWAPRAYFYRVVNITEVDPNVSPNTVELEVQTDISAQGFAPTGANGKPVPVQIAVLENVVEVFNKGGLAQW